MISRPGQNRMKTSGERRWKVAQSPGRWKFSGNRGQRHSGLLREFCLMSSALSACKKLVFWGFGAGMATLVLAQNAYGPEGGEYLIAGSLPGDQIFPQISVNSSGGYLVWQDNVTDGDGWGISARRLNSSLSGSFGVFRVNEQSAGEQENVRVALLKDGGAAFVWQGGTPGFQHIYA